MTRNLVYSGKSAPKAAGARTIYSSLLELARERAKSQNGAAPTRAELASPLRPSAKE